MSKNCSYVCLHSSENDICFQWEKRNRRSFYGLRGRSSKQTWKTVLLRCQERLALQMVQTQIQDASPAANPKLLWREDSFVLRMGGDSHCLLDIPRNCRTSCLHIRSRTIRYRVSSAP